MQTTKLAIRFAAFRSDNEINYKFQNSQAAKILVWFLALAVIATPITIPNTLSNINRNVLLNSLMFALSRNIWGVGTACLIFICHHDGGGFVNTLLSNKFWIPISKLTYSLYLVHPIIQYNFTVYEAHPINLESASIVRFLKKL